MNTFWVYPNWMRWIEKYILLFRIRLFSFPFRLTKSFFFLSFFFFFACFLFVFCFLLIIFFLFDEWNFFKFSIEIRHLWKISSFLYFFYFPHHLSFFLFPISFINFSIFCIFGYMIDWLIDFNGMLTCLGSFYA